MSSQPQCITSDDLPVTLKKEKLMQKVKAQKWAGNVLLTLGSITLLVGGLTLLFGPSSLRISYTGPTFTEFILLYPGPIASIGLLLLFAGNMIKGTALSPIETYVQENYTLLDDFGQPSENAVVSINASYDGTITLHYLPVEFLHQNDKPVSELTNPDIKAGSK